MEQQFYAHGKLLLSGEYFITEGAKGIAVPTRLGQYLDINIDKNITEPFLYWTSKDADGSIWFQGRLDLKTLVWSTTSPTSKAVEDRLTQIIKAIKVLNPSFLQEKVAWTVTTLLEFPRKWGLGTSSTLISNLATWANVDPYKLLEMTFGGSGYDIAAATMSSMLSYQRLGSGLAIENVSWSFPLTEQLYFVYLEKKQNSRTAMKHYRAIDAAMRKEYISTVNTLSNELLSKTVTLQQLEHWILAHETLVAKVIQQKRAKQRYFQDYWGEVKSLGAWGGDFVLVTSNKGREQTSTYFAERGYETFIPFSELVILS